MSTGEKLDADAKSELVRVLGESNLKLTNFNLDSAFHRGMLAVFVIGNPMWYMNHSYYQDNDELKKEWMTIFDNNIKATLKA